MRTWFLLLALIACGGDDDTDTDLDTDTDTDTTPGDTDTPTGTPCEQLTEPLTWDNFAHDFFETSCQVCHASDAANRNGAPADVVFDTEEDVEAFKSAILMLATGPNPSMPPPGGPVVSDEDREKLELYLTCP